MKVKEETKKNATIKASKKDATFKKASFKGNPFQ
jgi:hypothetical protein